LFGKDKNAEYSWNDDGDEDGDEDEDEHGDEDELVEPEVVACVVGAEL
jgi:hypothetical protein